MKKIILAVASVMALGLFASCQREISGDLTITENTHSLDRNSTTTKYFEVSGSYTKTETRENAHKVAGSAEVADGKTVITTTYTFDKAKTVTVLYTEDKLNNKTAWEIKLPAGTTHTVSTSYNGTGTKIGNSTYSDGTFAGESVWVDYVDGKYYVGKTDGTWAQVSFNPYASEIDLSVLSDATAWVNVSYADNTVFPSVPDSRVYDADGNVVSYTKKETTTYTGKAYSAKLTQK